MNDNVLKQAVAEVAAQISKTLTYPTDFTYGGDKGRIATQDFIEDVIDGTSLLKVCDRRYVDSSMRKIPCLFNGGVQMVPTTENTDVSFTGTVYNEDIDIDLTPIALPYAMTEKVKDEAQIPDYVARVYRSMQKVFVDNVEFLLINGDASGTYSGSTDTIGALLNINNGWDYLTNSSVVVDAGGSTPDLDVLLDACKHMPAMMHARSANLRWIAHPQTIAWLKAAEVARLTGVGDRALLSENITTFNGYPFLPVSHIPVNKSVSTLLETNAEYTCRVANAPRFVITASSNDRVELTISAIGAPQVATLTAGSYTPWALAAHIIAALNTAGSTTLYNDCVRVDSNNRIVFRDPTDGATSALTIGNTGPDARITAFYATIGMMASTPASYTGSASGVAGTSYDGTFLWLADPMNFSAVMRSDIRASYDYYHRADRHEWILRNSVDAVLQRSDLVLKVTNLKLTH